MRRRPPWAATGPSARPYVDNGNVLGTSRAAVGELLELLCDELTDVGFVVHEKINPTDRYEFLGLELDGRRRLLRHKSSRCWRLWFALREIEQRRRLAPSQLRVVVGHLVNHLSLSRPAMSILHDVYEFVGREDNHVQPLPEGVLRELTVAKGFIFVLDWELGRPAWPEVFSSDASTEGYALHCTTATVPDILDAAKWRERWRFLPVHPPVARACSQAVSGGVLGSAEPTAPAFEAWVDSELADLEPAPPAKKEVRPPQPHEGRVHRMVATALPPLDNSWIDPGRWRCLVAGRWARPTAIHNKECRAALLGLARTARTPSAYGHLVLSLGDNLAEVLAVDRARARDLELPSLVQRASGIQLATGLRWARRYIETDRNVSDSDSRLADRWALLPGQRISGKQLQAAPLAAAVPPEWLENNAEIIDEYNLRSFDDVDDAFEPVWDGEPARSLRPRRSTQRRAAASTFKMGRCGPRDRASATADPPKHDAAAVQHLRPPRHADRVRRDPERAAPGARRRGRMGVRAVATSAALAHARPRQPRARRRAGLQLRGMRPPRGRAFLELFAGCARTTSAVSSLGLRVCAPCDNPYGVRFDLCHRKVQRDSGVDPGRSDLWRAPWNTVHTLDCGAHDGLVGRQRGPLGHAVRALHAQSHPRV